MQASLHCVRPPKMGFWAIFTQKKKKKKSHYSSGENDYIENQDQEKFLGVLSLAVGYTYIIRERSSVPIGWLKLNQFCYSKLNQFCYLNYSLVLHQWVPVIASCCARPFKSPIQCHCVCMMSRPERGWGDPEGRLESQVWTELWRASLPPQSVCSSKGSGTWRAPEETRRRPFPISMQRIFSSM